MLLRHFNLHLRQNVNSMVGPPGIFGQERLTFFVCQSIRENWDYQFASDNNGVVRETAI